MQHAQVYKAYRTASSNDGSIVMVPYTPRGVSGGGLGKGIPLNTFYERRITFCGMLWYQTFLGKVYTANDNSISV